MTNYSHHTKDVSSSFSTILEYSTNSTVRVIQLKRYIWIVVGLCALQGLLSTHFERPGLVIKCTNQDKIH